MFPAINFHVVGVVLLLLFYLSPISSVAIGIDPEGDGSTTPCEGSQPGRLDLQIVAPTFLDEYSAKAEKLCRRLTEKRWKYLLHVSAENKKQLMEAQLDEVNLVKDTWENVQRFDITCLKDPEVRRQFEKLSVIDLLALNATDFEEVSDVIDSMLQNLNDGKNCAFGTSNYTERKCDIDDESDISPSLKFNSDPNDTLSSWISWHESVGSRNRKPFSRLIPYLNKAARLNGFNDWGELWRDRYEVDDLESTAWQLWKEIRPLYAQLHAYVRRKLFENHPDMGIKADGPIPAHALGSMFADNWKNLFNITRPFPNNTIENYDDILKNLDFTPVRMFKLVESFYTSLGMEPMTREFWEGSVLQKPYDPDFVCNPSAWDFCNGRDFRVKQCTEISHDHLVNALRELSRIEYYMSYSFQPFVFRDQANSAFFDAIGKAMSLSMINGQYFQRIGVSRNISADNGNNACHSNSTPFSETDINFLLEQALEIVAPLPFDLLVDQWRWKIFAGDIDQGNLNSEWWQLRLLSQGISSPVHVTEDHFQLGSFYHVIANKEQIKYFLGSIMQFQIYEALCSVTEPQTTLLHQCDIYGSEKAGKLLKGALQLGSSRPWPEVMSLLTGGKSDGFDSRPLLRYFEPLHRWLRQTNENEFIGWKI